MWSKMYIIKARYNDHVCDQKYYRVEKHNS